MVFPLSRPLRRSAVGAVVFVAAAAFVAFGPRAALADTATTGEPAPAAAGWLARQLVDGERFEVVFEPDVFWDQGLTIDAIFAFAAAGASGGNAQKAIDWLDDPVVADNYYGSFDADPATATAGSLAKLVLAAQVTGKNPTAFAGTDLVSLLLTLQNPTTGRFTDTGPFGDSANAFGQSLATIALLRTGNHATQAANAAGFLASIQCDDGGFPLSLAGPTTAPDCDSQVDTTAIAVQALLAAGQATVAGEGLDWLISKQKTGGGFADESDIGLPVNANSTGLAGEALRAGGRNTAADKAAGYLATLQVGCAGDAANRGAIAYDATGFDPATATRATAQAILGLAGVSLADLTTNGAGTDAPTLLCTTPTTTPTTAPTTAPATTTPGPTATPTATTTTGVVPTTSTTSPATALPTTGASLGPILATGGGLIIVGGVLLLVGRLRRDGSPT
jgi:hypothetical protein